MIDRTDRCLLCLISFFIWALFVVVVMADNPPNLAALITVCATEVAIVVALLSCGRRK